MLNLGHQEFVFLLANVIDIKKSHPIILFFGKGVGVSYYLVNLVVNLNWFSNCSWLDEVNSSPGSQVNILYHRNMTPPTVKYLLGNYQMDIYCNACTNHKPSHNIINCQIFYNIDYYEPWVNILCHRKMTPPTLFHLSKAVCRMFPMELDTK